MSIGLSESAELEFVEGQATYGMSNLRSTKTGLPFIVFISQRDDAKHAARIKWSPEPRVDANNMGSYAVSPFGFKAGRKLSSSEEKLLERWVALNKDVLLGYWNGDIAYTEDAVSSLKKLD